MSKLARQFYEFGPFRVDAAKRLLLRDGEMVSVAPKAYEILLVLLQNSGRVMEKDELMSKVWPDTVVEENNLTVNMSALRRALGESKGEHRYIVTVPGRGYQFAASVNELWDEETDLVLQEQTLSRLVIEEQERDGEQNGSTDIGAGHVAPISSASVRPRLIRGTRSLIVLALLLLAITTVSYIWMGNKPKQSEAGARPRSIAVLPFKPLATEGRDESLELGMADTLIFRLSGLRGLVVRPISAVRKYADLNQDPLAAGREQQVDAVLDSTIQIAGGKVRVTARLVRVADGAVLWADRGEQQSADLFAVQDAIAEKLAGSLALKLTDEERQRLTRRYTDNSEAYQLYLRGRYFSEKRTRDGITKGIEYFRQAIEKDPDYALAYAGLADSYTLLRLWAFAPAKETVPQARAAAEKALRLDDSLAEAHAALARVKEHSLDWSGAEIEYRRAVELNPNYETAHHWYATHLAAMGRLDEAMAEVRRAQELDPLSLIINLEVGRILYFRRQNDQAIAQLQKTLEMDPNFGATHVQLGVAYEQTGMYEEAIAEYQKMPSGGLARIGRVYALSGKRREAQKVLDELKGQSVSPVGNNRRMAVIYAGLGENEQAIAWLEKALDEGDEDFLYFLRVDPMWDGLRSEPRFQDLLRRMGLSQ
jgi:DNA-binding winged helix-turn-helix (wHTH) protein/TolB-like protein/cytochrome c-type biogenesis protein CcmH/NrfG